jgi:hypothetical protein
VKINTGLTGDGAAAMVCSTQYMRFRQSLDMSSGERRYVGYNQCVGQYVFHSEGVCGGVWWIGRTFSQPQVGSNAGITVPGRETCRYIQFSKSALYLIAMSSNSQSSTAWRDCKVEMGRRNVAPRHIKYVTAAVICYIHSHDAGRS